MSSWKDIASAGSTDFTFTPEASSAGSEAKTLAGAAQKALAGEIDRRSGKLSQASDEQFVLATDGVIRWMGQPVGRLVAAEEVLKPRVRIVADEQLTGASRDNVQTRLDLWLKTYIEKVLGSLFQLGNAEDITGIARGVAFQLVESLGILERAKVTDEVKGLDQPTRATLRKYGVRFGAYNLYLPLLVKPAPRLLALQLYALKHDGADTTGFDVVERLAASGRTSIAINPDISATLYRTAGYRICGERAVRVDILERLADIIRPALAWRAGSAGAKPAAAFDGFGFVVTTPMTSLAGCSGEEFASILRALSYRMEKRPKPTEPAAAKTAAPADLPAAPVESDPTQSVAQDGQTDNAIESGVGTALPDEGVDVAASEPISESERDAPPTEPAHSGALSESPDAGHAHPDEKPDPDAVSDDTRADIAAATSIPEAEPAVVVEAASPAVQTAEQDDAQTSPTVSGDLQAADSPSVATDGEVPATADHAQVDPSTVDHAPVDHAAADHSSEISAPAEPEMIEVWRPGRPERPRRERPPQRDHVRRPFHRGPTTPSAVVGEGANAPAASAVPPDGSQPADGPQREHRRRPRHRHGDRPRGDAPVVQNTTAPATGELSQAPPAEAPSDQAHRDTGDRPDRGDRRPRRDERPDQRPRSSDRFDRSQRGDRPQGNRPPRSDRPDRDPELRAKYIKGRNESSGRRDKAPDPDSPFAKLAALKEQLEAGAKER